MFSDMYRLRLTNIEKDLTVSIFTEGSYRNPCVIATERIVVRDYSHAISLCFVFLSFVFTDGELSLHF